MKHTLINARSFSGTETSSDHRLVICILQAKNITSSKMQTEHTARALTPSNLYTKNAY